MIEILLNDVTLEGMRRVKAGSDSPIDTTALPVCVPSFAQVHPWSDELLGLHYLEATWACRAPVKIKGEGWKEARDMVLWKMAAGERVSVAFRDAVRVYLGRFKRFPDYAFLRRLPKEIDNGFDIGDVYFMEAEWVPAGCIAICEGD